MENWFLEVIQDVHTKNFFKLCLIFGLSFLSRQDELSREYLRSKQHVPCVYQVVEMQVEVWENEKYRGNTSRRQMFPQLFWVLPSFPGCFYNSIETQRTCFLFLLENTARKKGKQLVNFDCQNVNSPCSCHH